MLTLYFDGMSQRCFPCDTGWIIARPLQCCGNVFLWRWNDIIVTLRAVEETDLMAHCQLFLTADCDDLLSTVKDKVQACLIF